MEFPTTSELQSHAYETTIPNFYGKGDHLYLSMGIFGDDGVYHAYEAYKTTELPPILGVQMEESIKTLRKEIDDLKGDDESDAKSELQQELKELENKLLIELSKKKPKRKPGTQERDAEKRENISNVKLTSKALSFNRGSCKTSYTYHQRHDKNAWYRFKNKRLGLATKSKYDMNDAKYRFFDCFTLKKTEKTEDEIIMYRKGLEEWTKQKAAEDIKKQENSQQIHRNKLARKTAEEERERQEIKTRNEKDRLEAIKNEEQRADEERILWKAHYAAIEHMADLDRQSKSWHTSEYVTYAIPETPEKKVVGPYLRRRLQQKLTGDDNTFKGVVLIAVILIAILLSYMYARRKTQPIAELAPCEVPADLL